MYSFTAGAERRLLWLLALTQFTVIMDFMVMMPLGPQIMHSFHIEPAGFATAVSAYSWCAGLSGLFAVTYIDRFNRRSLLLTMYALFALSNLACAFANSFALLLLARAFAGVSGGIIGSVIMAIVGDVIPVERRGAAAGTIMSAFSLAAVVGVPSGIVLAAHFGWPAPFLLLLVLSALIGGIGRFIVPSLTGHLKHDRAAPRAVFQSLGRVLLRPNHVNAFAMTFVMMVSQMMVVPFISPMLVANHGVSPARLSWLYMAGGIAPFFTSRFIGRLADRYGYKTLLRTMVLFSIAPMLIITHLPPLPFVVIVLFFPLFMIATSGRMVPLQALMITVPNPAARGSFLSANSSFQSLGSGCGAWLGGLMLSSGANGAILGYGRNGWVSSALAVCVVCWVARVHGDSPIASARGPQEGAVASQAS